MKKHQNLAHFRDKLPRKEDPAFKNLNLIQLKDIVEEMTTKKQFSELAKKFTDKLNQINCPSSDINFQGRKTSNEANNAQEIADLELTQ